jgi:ACS family hexuronate transporter-like MFS transporter
MRPETEGDSNSDPGAAVGRRKLANVRWWIVGVLFCGSLVNYLDRVALSIVAPQIRDEFHLTHGDYALILNLFMAAYAVSYAGGGKLADWLGTRATYYLTVSWWSAAACLHSLSRGLASLGLFRLLLGFGEAGYFPTGIRAISEWFRPVDRSKAVGILLMGLSVGALLGPPTVAFLTLRFGWRAMFAVTGALGFLLLAPWTILYRRPGAHPWLTEAERDYLAGIPGAKQAEEERISVREFLRQRVVWTLILARLLLDSTNYFFLFWIPDYLVRERGFSMAMIGGLLWIPYLFSDVGMIVGGWTSSALIRRGSSVAFARKSCMLLSSTLLLFGILINVVAAPASIIALISIALFGFAILAVNIQTVATDVAPSHSVGTLYGIAGAAGSLGAVAWQTLIGKLADAHRYDSIFLLVSVLPVATALIMLTAPIETLRRPGAAVAARVV